jgi:hypothetical protein
VCSQPTEAAGLIGTDFLKVGAIINLECDKMSLTDIGKAPRADGTTLDRGTAFTIFLEGKEGHSPQPIRREVQGTDKQVPAENPRERISSSARTWLVRARENITMAPRSQHVVIGKIESEKTKELHPLVCVEPAHIAIEGILPARVLTRVGCGTGEKPPMTSQTDQMVTKLPDTSAYVMLTNFSEQTMTVPKSTVRGIVEEVSEPLVEKFNEKNAKWPQKPEMRKKNEALYGKLLKGKLDHLKQEDSELIEPILVKYAHVFHDEETNDFKAPMS